MSTNPITAVSLDYGEDCHFTCEIEAGRLAVIHRGPDAVLDFAEELRFVLQHPLDFPPLEQAVVPGDCVALVLDRHTPCGATIIAEVWKILERRSIEPQDVIIVQPVAMDTSPLPDPRAELPETVREKMRWAIHDPTDESERMYLATTTSGERIYLSRDVVAADFVLPIGQIAYDPVIGYRGTTSVLYPGLSSSEEILRTHGQGQSELHPDDERALRNLMDEIGWLMGLQFTIQVVAGTGGGVNAVLAGANDSVLRRGRALLAENWLVQLDERPQVVVAAVESDAAGHGWDHIAAALAVAKNLVEPDGKIVILTDLDAELGDGLRLLKNSRSPRDAIKPIGTSLPPDLIAATRVATAVDWARVFLLSRLDHDLVEDLFMTPVANDLEIERLIGNAESCAFLSAAQHTFGLTRSV